jgi:hypothetical protein
MWQYPETHCCVIHLSPSPLCFSILMHSPKDLYTIPRSWKWPCSSMASILTRCHPLSLFGMLWINMYDSVFQFPPISSNFAQPLKSSGTTFHNQHPDQQLYAKEMCHAANGSHTRYWLVFWSTPPTFFPRYLWQTDAYLYSQSCEIHRLGPNEFI